MLDKSYASKDLIPSGFAHLYKKVGDEFVLKSGTDLRSDDDFNRVNEALRKEREDHKALKTKFKVFGDRDPDEIIADLDKIEEYKLAADAGGVDDDKVNSIVETRLRTLRAPLDRQVADLTEQLETATGQVSTLQTTIDNRDIESVIRAAAVKAGLNDGGIEDAIFRGTHVLHRNENNEIVTRDGVPNTTPGVDPSVWLINDMIPNRPNWLKDSAGAGATGNAGAGGAGAVNPFSRKDWNVTDQGRMVRTNPEQAKQMAERAGTTVGGGMPPAAEK